MAAQEHPEMQGNALSRLIQKQKIKRQYAKQAREAAKQGAKAAEKTAVTTEKLAARVVGFVKRHPVGALLFVAVFLLLVMMQSCMSSLATLGNGTARAVGASTYPAEDADLLGAEAAYCALEAELQNYLDTYTSTHSYDEYHFDLDEIEHDPYVLLSIISAWHEGEWTLAEVQDTLQMLFDRQYTLTETVVTETRYDAEGDPYTWYICYVTLESENLPTCLSTSWARNSFPGMPSTWRRWATVPICSPAPTMWASTRVIPWSMKSPRNIWRTKPFPPCSPRRRSTSAIPMSGAAPARPLHLTAPATSHGCSINAAGMWGGWGPRAYTTTVPPPAHPSRAIWCFLSAPTTRWGSAIVGCMWAMAGCSIVATPSAMPTSTAAIGNLISTPTGVYHEWRSYMAISKSAKIEAEIEKVKAKISEQQARLKELEQKKVEAENSEIVDIVRGMSIPLAELPVVLQQIRAGATLGQNVPKSETEDKEDSE